MLDKFLEVSYRAGAEKTASRTLVDRLKEFPLEELKKLASGDTECKLAFALDACGPGGDSSWLGKYTGTPLFSKAVELEKALLQIDMEEQQARAAAPPMNDSWQKRDAIRLQQRMLDLDLVMAANGGAPAEAGAGAAPSAEELSTADAPELALEQGGPPKAPKGPPPPPAEAAPSPEEEEAAALEMAAEEAAAGGGAPQEGPPQQAAPPKPKPKAPPKEEEEEPEEEGGPKIEVKQSAAKVAAIVSAGRFLAKTASDPKGEAARAEIAKKFPHLVKEKTAAGNAGQIIDGLTQGGHELASLAGGVSGGVKAHDATGGSGLSTIIGGARGALGASMGAGLGRSLGERVGGVASRALSPMGLSPGVMGAVQPAAAALGTLGGGLLGYKALTGVFNKQEKKPKSKHEDEKTAGLIGSVLNAGKAAMPAVGGVLQGAKNLATTANAAGGLPQVAKSFGGVAKNFAMKNPLAAAGVAGAGGMVAGKMLSNSQPRA